MTTPRTTATRLALAALAASLTTSLLAACATAPPPAPDFAPPGKRPLDAKTQLESGRRY